MRKLQITKIKYSKPVAVPQAYAVYLRDLATQDRPANYVLINPKVWFSATGAPVRPFYIENLPEDVNYVVALDPLCGGVMFKQIFLAGQVVLGSFSSDFSDDFDL